MNFRQKEKLFKYLARHFDSMDYPPIILWKPIKRELIKKAWRHRVKKIINGALDYPGLYIHIPYCQTKCFFCKFKVRVGNSGKMLNRYLKYLKNEIEEFSPLLKKVPFKTLYLAGGTPTIFSAHQLDALFTLLEEKFNLIETSQRLIEATPATLSLEKLRVLKKHGINRLTIGIQVLDKKLLTAINRRNQTEKTVRSCYNQARQVGIKIINIDLVVGLPGQTAASFLKDVNFVLQLRPDAIHIFSYEEENLVIFYMMGKRITDKDRTKRDQMLELADGEIRKYGYRSYRGEAYLLSPGAANFQFQYRYSVNGSLLGLGAEALSYIPGYYAYENFKTEEYLNYGDKDQFPPYLNGYPLNKDETCTNYIINNIRDGLDKTIFRRLYRVDFNKTFRKEINFLKRLGILQESRERIKLIARNDFEFRTYSKFFFSPRIIKELKAAVKARNK